MSEQQSWTRRSFLQSTAVAGTVAALATTAEPVGAVADRKEKLKIGCLSWNFHSFDAGADCEKAVEIIGDMDFEGIDLILNQPVDIKDYWTEDRIGRIKKKLDQYKLQVSQFVLFQPVVGGLSSVRATVREQSLDNFAAGCRIAKKLDAQFVNFVA